MGNFWNLDRFSLGIMEPPQEVSLQINGVETGKANDYKRDANN